MKKLVLITLLVFFITSCTTIEKSYTGKRVRVEPSPRYDHSPYYGYTPYYDYTPYYGYSPYYGFSPFYWTGFSMWNPFWYYGLFGQYYGYYGRYYGGYPYYGYRGYGYRGYGRSVITKRQLKSKPAGRVSRIKTGGTSVKIKNTRGIRATSIRSGSAGSRISTSSRGSSGRVKVKK